ncbi:hypothetical protein [Subdoligranulum variabile]|uniref:Tat pathway signal sequence domain protein n=1 Tax=Subdoligranulum variabile DSM 15176 TaxID=411471 RepID=D1PM21_9FIRM|nr:hypothetical protein [Subdoligranulum variabile]EFB76286.1 hypothetical protein SUBVAR_06072 [Subdoligranulum variabile DSM 15176]UWP68908.1 hypothetical protein NQ490_03405 [Subdoligranulum variabile]
MKRNFEKKALPAVTLLVYAVYFLAMCWLHHQQLCVTDGFASDLPQHLEEALRGEVYTAAYLLIPPAYALAGKWGMAVLLAIFQIAALAVFAWGLRAAAPRLPAPVRLLLSLVVNLAQAAWIPRGGYWYIGTINGTIYHNTTYIMLAPFALLAMLCFYRAWQGMHTGLDVRTWLVYTVLLTLSTAFKANFVFAFAPALLLLLIADLIRTRGKNLKREILIGCSVLPSIALCLLESVVLFSGESGGGGLELIFSVDPAYFENGVISWGLFSESARRGMIRSLVFVGAVAVLLGRAAWGHFRYRFSLLTFAVAMAEALLIVEGGERIGHGNLWWGPFICYWVFLFESFCAFLRAGTAWKSGQRQALLGGRLLLCGAMLVWQIISGICFLVLLMQGNSYNIPIATWQFWPF